MKCLDCSLNEGFDLIICKRRIEIYASGRVVKCPHYISKDKAKILKEEAERQRLEALELEKEKWRNLKKFERQEKRRIKREQEKAKKGT